MASKKIGVVYITPRGNMFVAEEGLRGEAYDKVVVEMFGKEELIPCERENIFEIVEEKECN